MADEKIIRITADASGVGAEMDRTAASVQRAFSDIGLDDLLSDADKQFDKIGDKIKAISDELKNKLKDANDEFERRKSDSGGNEFYQRSIQGSQDDYNKRHEKAMSEWEKLADKLSKKSARTEKGGGSGEESSQQSGENSEFKNIIARSIGQSGQDLGGFVGRLFPGDMGRSLGKGLGNILNRGGSGMVRGLGTGGTAAEVGAGEAAVGGEAATGAGAAGGSMAALGVVAVVAAVALAIKQLYGMGMEDWRTESKVNATFDINRDTFGKGGDAFGLSNTDYKEFILSAAKSRGSATNVQDIARKELSFMKGYGLNEGEVRNFDKFNYQDITGRDGTMVIVDILTRAEKQGILGVSAGDFSRLPEKIEQVGNIMAYQKMSGEKVNSLDAVNFMSAGSQIGGRFGDDRASEVYGRMNESIKNPSNPGMKAFIYEMLKKSNPNASFTDIQGMMENGASGENLQAILPQISKMPQGEMRRMVLFQLTKNMQDAIRLDGAGNLDAMLKSSRDMGVTPQEAKSRYDQAMERTATNQAAMDQLGKIISNSLTDFGEKYIARPFNDMIRSGLKGDASGMMLNFMKLTSPGLIGSGQPIKQNTVQSKTE